MRLIATLLAAAILIAPFQAIAGFKYAGKTGSGRITDTTITEHVGWTPFVTRSGSPVPTASSRGPVLIPGAKGPTIIDVDARVVNAAEMLIGMGRFATPIGAVIQLAMLAEALEQSGLSDVKRTATGWSAKGDADALADSYWEGGVPGAKYSNQNSACAALSEYNGSTTGGFSSSTWGQKPARAAECKGTTLPSVDGNNNPVPGVLVVIGTVFELANEGGSNPGTGGQSEIKMTDQQLADKLKQAGIPDSALPLLDQALNDPNASPQAKLEPSQVTGPDTVPGPTTTTESSPDADGKTTTTTVTNTLNLVYNGPQITTTTTTTTTTTVKNPDGSVDSTKTDTTTSEEPNKETGEDSLLCSVFPDILACKKLEDPGTEEIPKETRTIELQSGPDFSGGSCIPDVVVTVFGNQITVLAMAEPCRWIETMLKPLILLFAAMSAVFIVMPRSD